jgi:hypothetical protein
MANTNSGKAAVLLNILHARLKKYKDIMENKSKNRVAISLSPKFSSIDII